MRLLVLILVLALAGCGGGAAGTSAESYASSLVAALENVSPNGSTDIAALADGYHSASDQLAAVTPPAQIADAHSRLVAGLRAQAVYLDAVAAAGDTGTAAAAAQGATQAGQAWTAALIEIKAAGYANVSP